MALRSLSLCAGIGGLDLGLRDWLECVCYVEREAFAASVLVARMEEAALDRAPVWSDLATFDARAWRGVVDCVVAGYPCQPFSQAGKRLGAADPRHLWPHVLRVLVDSGARVGFFENVVGHVKNGLPTVLADLAAAGFSAVWRIGSARDVGAPHLRRRLFVLAYSDRGALRDLRRGRRGPGRPGPRLPGFLGEDVADADRHGREQLRCGCLQHGVGSPLGNDADGPRGPSESVGDADEPRLEGRSVCGLGGPNEPTAGSAVGSLGPAAHERWPEPYGRRGWPPRPDDTAAWGRIPAFAQPAVRRGAHGIPDRVDRLRALGNAVCPAQAADNFAHLLAEAEHAPAP